jgi:hypothetical protein
MRGYCLEYPQGAQRQSIVGGWHVKFSLTVGQRVSLFECAARNNLSGLTILNGAHIMNEISFVTRLAQGFLAVTIVSAIVAAIQFSLLD